MRSFKTIAPSCLPRGPVRHRPRFFTTLALPIVPGPKLPAARYSVDTATAAQTYVMSLEGIYVFSLASSPVPDSIYALDVVAFGTQNYTRLRLVDVQVRTQRLVGCGRTLPSQGTFDARHDMPSRRCPPSR